MKTFSLISNENNILDVYWKAKETLRKQLS